VISAITNHQPAVAVIQDPIAKTQDPRGQGATEKNETEKRRASAPAPARKMKYVRATCLLLFYLSTPGLLFTTETRRKPTTTGAFRLS
jgi:hypothetical protein